MTTTETDDDFFAEARPLLAAVPADPDDDFFAEAPPPDGPRIPRHRAAKDRRPWIRHADDPDPAPELKWEEDRGIWVLANQARDRKRGSYFTRASSFAKGLDDPHLRHEASKRKVAYGLTRHPELVRLGQGIRTLGDERGEDGKLTPAASADRRAWNDLAAKAEEYAGGIARTMLGTGFHDLRHQRDAGVDLSHLDEDTAAALELWCRVTEPLELLSSEQFVVNYDRGAGGSYDALSRVRRTIAVLNRHGEVMGHVERGERVVVDLKSGWWGMEFAGPCWGCQAEIYDGGQPYDHDRGAYDWAELGGEPNHRWAVIVACSPERPSEAGLHWVNLEAARLRAKAVPLWKAACVKGDLFFAHDPAAELAEPVTIQAAIAHRIERAPDEAALLEIWQAHEAQWTDELTDRVTARLQALADVERGAAP